MRLRSATLLAAVTVLLVAACGGNDDGDTQAATTTASTSTTTTTVQPTTTTLSPEQQLEVDKAAIRHLIEYENTAYRVNPTEGAIARASANYFVWNGTYTAQQCVDFLLADGGADIAVDTVLHADTIVATPEWVDPVLGTPPEGRVYSYTVDLTVRHVPTGVSDKRTSTVHASVLPDGTAKQFFDCVER